MKKPLETARRWLAQAEHSLSIATLMLENGAWSDTCFHSEQTAQLGLKAFLFVSGSRFINIHSVRQLAVDSTERDDQFSRFIDYGAVLDRYYLGTRYPDALPEPAIPFQWFTESDARQALNHATEIVELVQTKIPQSSPE